MNSILCSNKSVATSTRLLFYSCHICIWLCSKDFLIFSFCVHIMKTWQMSIDLTTWNAWQKVISCLLTHLTSLYCLEIQILFFHSPFFVEILWEHLNVVKMMTSINKLLFKAKIKFMSFTEVLPQRMFLLNV